jgi:hypothetical protein
MGVGTLASGVLEPPSGRGVPQRRLARAPNLPAQSLDGPSRVRECRIGVGYERSYKWHLDTLGPMRPAHQKSHIWRCRPKQRFQWPAETPVEAGTALAFTVSMWVRVRRGSPGGWLGGPRRPRTQP